MAGEQTTLLTLECNSDDVTPRSSLEMSIMPGFRCLSSRIAKELVASGLKYLGPTRGQEFVEGCKFGH